MNQMQTKFIVCVLAFGLSACSKMDAAPTLHSLAASQATEMLEGAPATPDATSETVVVEPPLPELAVVEYLDARSIAAVISSPLAAARPDAVVAELAACQPLLRTNITYDSIVTVPLVPDSVHINVGGDLLIQNASQVDLLNIAGSVAVERSEGIEVTNLSGKTAVHSMITRFGLAMLNIWGLLSLDAVAIHYVDNLRNSGNITTHAINYVDGDSYLQEGGRRLCLSAQDVGYVSRFVGSVVLIGRHEAGDPAYIDHLASNTGSAAIIGMNFDYINGMMTSADEALYLEDSYASSITGTFAGPIYLNASKVDSITNRARSPTTVYLSNGAEVAATTGAVNVVRVQ